MVGEGGAAWPVVAAVAETAASPSGQPRVAIACPGVGHVFRGYERFARDLFAHLEPHIPVTLFKGLGPTCRRERSLSSLRRTSLPGRVVARVLSPRKAYDLESITFALSLHRALRGGDFDVVFLPDYRVARVVRMLRRIVPPRRPFAIAFHNSAPYAPRKLGGFDIVQEVTAPAQEEAAASGLRNSRLVAMPADVERFRPGAPNDGLRRELGISPECPVIVCAAAHEPFKRIDVLIEAVAAVQPTGGRAPPTLLISGQDGRATEHLRALAAARLGDRAVLRRFEPERMPEVYRLGDVFALPSRTEGFGLVLVEAMASGVPVVTQDDATRRWIVGDAGVLVECERPGALRDALATLLADPAERSRLGASGRARAIAAFSWDALTPAYLSFFEAARAAASRALSDQRCSPSAS